MSSLNKVFLIGNLTRDPETRYTQSGTAVGELGIAVNRKVKKGDKWEDETTFVDVTVWGSTADNAGKYLAKGRSVCVEGRLQLDTWEDKQSGQKRSKLKVVADSVQFLGGKQDGGTNQQPARQQSSQAHNGSWEDFDGKEDDNEEIPF